VRGDFVVEVQVRFGRSNEDYIVYFAASHCIKPPDLEDDGMHIAVPKRLFRNGEACGKKMLISCAEPYKDLGGPWYVCRNHKKMYVTVIDQVWDEPLDDDSFQLSHKAFNRLAIRGHDDSLRLFFS
jgi:hypothetical protein